MTTGARSEKSTAPVSRWNLRLGRFLGIDVYVHGTFLMLLGFLALAHWLPTRSVWAATSGVLFFVALFGCVLLHEYGHALAARYFGIGTRDITLMPMGGVARLERMPDRPTHELWIALAGPAVNVVIAAALGLGLWSVGALAPLSDLGPARGHFAQRLLVVNVFLVLFNMIPAFPMDGGRVLRALLAMRMELVKATRIAARLGQALAVVFGFAAFLGNPMLFLIAVFVWLGASTELRAVEAKSALEGFKVSQAMMTHFIALDPKDPIERAVREIMDGVQQDFPVVENSRVIGMLERRHLMEALAKLGSGTPVEAIMLREFPTLHPGDLLTSVLTRHSLQENPMMPVVSGERLVGLLTTDNITELLLIHAALQGSGGLGVWAAKPVFPVDREWCEKPAPWRPVAGGWDVHDHEAPPVIRPVGRE